MTGSDVSHVTGSDIGLVYCTQNFKLIDFRIFRF